MHSVFDQDDFFERFNRDIDAAKALVLIQSPFITARRIRQIREVLRQAVTRGVRICVFVQTVDSRFVDPLQYKERREAQDIAAQALVSIGVHVNTRDGIHEKLVTVDDRILWEGSLNPLSYLDTKERMNRWIDGAKVRSAVLKHGLNDCSSCDKEFEKGDLKELFGRLVRKRRKLLGVNQAELSKSTGVSQSTISRIERGEFDFRLSTITCLFDWLGVSCRPVPWHMVPSTDKRILEVLREEDKLHGGD